MSAERSPSGRSISADGDTDAPVSPRIPPAPHPDSGIERARQALVDGFCILDTPPEEAFDDLVQLAKLVCDAPTSSLTFIDRDRQWFKAAEGFGANEAPREKSICNLAIRSPGQLFEVDDVRRDRRIAVQPKDEHGRDLNFYAGIPLATQDGIAFGTLCVLDHAPRRLSERQAEALRKLGRQAEQLLELRRYALQQRAELQRSNAAAEQLQFAHADLQRRAVDLKREARHDPLTGLLNRSGLDRLRAHPDAMARLCAGAYALALVDIDFFKRINDTHGHLLGDEALRAVAVAIRDGIRLGDVAVRYGGEEFLVVLPQTALPGAWDVAQRIRAAVGALTLQFPITVSIGVAAGDPARDAPEEVFDRADQALYRAKADGRDRVVLDDTLRA